jgi:hypothetical protein
MTWLAGPANSVVRAAAGVAGVYGLSQNWSKAPDMNQGIEGLCRFNVEDHRSRTHRRGGSQPFRRHAAQVHQVERVVCRVHQRINGMRWWRWDLLK